MTDTRQRTRDAATGGIPAARCTTSPGGEAKPGTDDGTAAIGPFPARLRTSESAKRGADRPSWWAGHLRRSFR